MSIAPSGPGTLRQVTARLNFAIPIAERLRFPAGDQEGGNVRFEPHQVCVSDLRAIQEQVALDRQGFLLARHPTALADIRDTEAVERLYKPEIEKLILRVTGAAKAVANKVGLARVADSAPQFGAKGTLWPIRQVHADYMDASGHDFALSLLPEEERSYWAGKRTASFSVWRAVSPPPQDTPLAVLDWSSIAPGDEMPADVTVARPGHPPITWEGGFLRHGENQRWGYFSRMERDEVLIIKMHDTDPARARRAYHTAFDDPSFPEATPRESLDIRVAAFFE